MINRRSFLAKLVPSATPVGVGVGAVAVASSAANAQEIPQFGIPLPSWFRSRSEQLAREACENGLPNCRPDVLKQLNAEKQFSLLTPWLLLGSALLVVLIYARKKEKEKEQHRREARRKHVPGAFKKLDQTKTEKDPEDMDDDPLA
ncbi:MAG: hypothetical protein KDE14_02895 [Rhodobacteraceae bacterium]|nr:hypothetical protein [Paracoccaceae bacterium]